MTTALRDSCCYYFYALGNDLGIYQLALYTEALGLGQPTGIELVVALYLCLCHGIGARD